MTKSLRRTLNPLKTGHLWYEKPKLLRKLIVKSIDSLESVRSWQVYTLLMVLTMWVDWNKCVLSIFHIYPRWEKLIYEKTVEQKFLFTSSPYLYSWIDLTHWWLLDICHQGIIRFPDCINQSAKSEWLLFWHNVLFYISHGICRRKFYGCCCI